jgi:hypothetical protein
MVKAKLTPRTDLALPLLEQEENVSDSFIKK